MTPSKTRRDFLRFGTALAALSVPFVAGGALAATAPTTGSNITGWPRYEWPIPWVPATAAAIDVVEVPVGGMNVADKGDPSKLLLLVAPPEPITGAVCARSLRYRGVVMIGAAFRKVGGGQKVAPSGASLPGGHVFQISFDGRVDRGGAVPFVYLASIRYWAEDSWWGDFLQVGTQRTPNDANQARWCDVYLQKILVGRGHYGWTAPGDDFAPHSDFIQANLGGIRSLNVADCDIAWGYQTFFARPDADQRAYPDGVFDFRRVMTRALPPSTAVYGGDGRRAIRFLTMTSSGADVASGNYYAHRASQFHVVTQPGTAQSLSRHFSASGLRSRIRGSALTWDTAKAANRRWPVWTGEIRTGEPAAPFVTRGETGTAWRVTGALALQRLAGVTATASARRR